ncbi:MAG: hypothetical protein LBD08_07185 [Treponema sp.]|jgi:hypothetical protein|nr:hypothetical protein [Treponema sp.]
MDTPPVKERFLTLDDLHALFPRLKRMEVMLAPWERQVLLKIERVLYEYHSVEELEALLQGPGGTDAAPGRRNRR